ncbi:MAG: glycosyltransferase family 2 protein [Bacteroidetes bacterium]|nr:glycosyltransferase family 2 protein [Bacteroidota bacterium]
MKERRRQMAPELSVVIVSYNVRDFLRKCLLSILPERTDFTFEVIVADNCSSDGTEEMMRSEFKSVRFIKNEKNLGFSEGNNRCFKIANGKYFLMLNPDTEIKAGALQLLMDRCKKEANECIVGPLLLNTNGSLQRSAWKIENLFHFFLDIFYLKNILAGPLYSKDMFSREFYPEALSGAALFFPRKIYEMTSGLDSGMFWMEDTDLCYRAKRSGAKCIFFPGAEIIHHSGKSAVQNLRITIPNQLVSKLKFTKKHRSQGSFFFSAVFFFIIIGVRVVIFFFLSPFTPLFRAKRKAYTYAMKKWFLFVFKNDRAIL